MAVIGFGDNRLDGLIREIEEAIAACDDPTKLYRLGRQLKLLGDSARGRGWDLQPKNGNRFW